MLTEVANINIPIPRFDPMTPKRQSSRRPHIHMWREEEQGGCRAPLASSLMGLQMLRRKGATSACPLGSGVVHTQFLPARKTDGNAGREFTPRETQTVHLVLPSVFSVKSEDFIINFVG